MKKYIRVKNSTGGGYLRDYITAKPVNLMLLFGFPNISDEYKVSGEFIFQDSENPEKVIYIYDWKSTNLYDEELQSPVSFWISGGNYEFHIGGGDNITESDIEDFKEFISNQIEENLK